MTLKRKEILNCSLNLFALKGIRETTTKQIANSAQVSEGLIFRHFRSKKGLVKAVMDSAFDRIAPYINDILELNDPRAVMENIIDLPIKLLRDEPTYWRLQMALKFQTSLEDIKENCKDHSPILYDKVHWALEELGFENAILEANLFHLTFEGLVQKASFSGIDSQLEEFVLFLKSKYNVSATTIS